jgi:tetratricopeptide (TPR) repeat protein
VFVLQPGDARPATSWHGWRARCRRGKGWRSCISAISMSRPATKEPATLDVLRTAAEIYDQRLGQVDQAKECYRRLLTVNTEDMAAFEPLESMLSRATRWNDLYSVYREAIRDTLDQNRKKSLLFKVSALQEERLEDPTAAIGTYPRDHRSRQ